ncbi:membrane protein insertion efficiency factor YidD [Thiorhodovibrio frisius]|uniref:membrane protein insertion efficiency factor YidD n=1 Tax=Thiorhodovibrio frisius TaxID=631362 RepID=UPI00030198D4|nr:membrane protein insertion efficiency factor YidD [Thiorhodovibrio frisius]
MRALIRAYQLFLSPVIGSHCRYHPTCSEYARQALALHGPVLGLGFALWRILRCQPWGSSGFDPVPEKKRDIPNG